MPISQNPVAQERFGLGTVGSKVRQKIDDVNQPMHWKAGRPLQGVIYRLLCCSAGFLKWEEEAEAGAKTTGCINQDGQNEAGSRLERLPRLSILKANMWYGINQTYV